MTSWNQPPGGKWRPLGSIRLAQEALGGGFPLVAAPAAEAPEAPVLPLPMGCLPGFATDLVEGLLFDGGIAEDAPLAAMKSGCDGLADEPAVARHLELVVRMSQGVAGHRVQVGPRHGDLLNLAAQITTYTAAKLMVEGLSQAGRDLSREKLLLALEGLYRYENGFTPPLTYGPNRHIGALGAHIVAVDVANRRFAAGSTWVELD